MTHQHEGHREACGTCVYHVNNECRAKAPIAFKAGPGSETLALFAPMMANEIACGDWQGPPAKSGAPVRT